MPYIETFSELNFFNAFGDLLNAQKQFAPFITEGTYEHNYVDGYPQKLISKYFKTTHPLYLT